MRAEIVRRPAADGPRVAACLQVVDANHKRGLLYSSRLILPPWPPGATTCAGSSLPSATCGPAPSCGTTTAAASPTSSAPRGSSVATVCTGWSRGWCKARPAAARFPLRKWRRRKPRSRMAGGCDAWCCTSHYLDMKRTVLVALAGRRIGPMVE